VKIAEDRATMYTPAVTIVAAWIKAETGVGPAMASGSQTYSGSCADFPHAPNKSRNAIAVSAGSDLPATAGNTVPKSSDPKLTTIRNMANENPKSPMRFTMNALLPASVANFLSK
jgi:hypothetical protein